MSKRLEKIQPYSPNFSISQLDQNNEKNSIYLKILSSKKKLQNYTPEKSKILNLKSPTHDSRFSYSQNSIFKNIELISNLNFDPKNSTFPSKNHFPGIAGSSPKKVKNSIILPNIDDR